jgi:hypothetical protein
MLLELYCTTATYTDASVREGAGEAGSEWKVARWSIYRAGQQREDQGGGGGAGGEIGLGRLSGMVSTSWGGSARWSRRPAHLTVCIVESFNSSTHRNEFSCLVPAMLAQNLTAS